MKNLILVLKIISISFIIILVIDFFIGHKILATIDPYLKETEFYEKRANIWHKKFHHTFKENINMKSTGVDEINRFCTNEHGFKSNCNFKEKNFTKSSMVFVKS